MAGSNYRSSAGLERRASTRHSLQALPPQDDDDDDYDLEASGISDGFRPANALNYSGHDRYPSQASQQSLYQTNRRSTPPPRPSSATKPNTLDSFALRHDGTSDHTRRTSATASPAPNSGPSRLSSASSDTAAFVQFESPYEGPSGPSYPYQMYPQAARPDSMATVSTARAPDRSYAGPDGPTHPYGMYAQNIAPDSDSTHDINAVPPVPVGFPGSNNDYRRRLGPDGEEIADIIGPDGHTEQLPPYSQYPDEAFARKNRPTVTVPVAGAGGMGLATRNPEFESREDLESPQSRQSSRSALSDRGEQQATSADPGPSEKPKYNRWQKAARRKVCGIVPVWALILAALVVIMFGVVTGTVLVALKPKHSRKGSNNPEADTNDVVFTTLTTTFDATPLSTAPAGLPALPTGTYALPFSAPSTIQNSCLVNTEQSKAWSCSMPASPLQVKVLGLPGAINPLANSEVIIDYGNATMGDCFPYGTQPPVLDDPQVLNLVTDSQEPERGPAWFFQTTYNKVVVVPEDVLSSPGSSKRALSSRDDNKLDDDDDGDDLPDSGFPSPADFKRRAVAQPGDKPWFCYWNGTLLEAFLYVNLTSSNAVRSSVVPASSTMTQTTIPSATMSARSASADSGPSSLDYKGPSWEGFPFLPAFPKVFKLQERRVPQGPQTIPPYCVQNIIAPDGTAQQILNSTGQPVAIYLNETDPDTIVPITSRRSILLNEALDKLKLKERQSSGNCGCVWVAT